MTNQSVMSVKEYISGLYPGIKIVFTCPIGDAPIDVTPAVIVSMIHSIIKEKGNCTEVVIEEFLSGPDKPVSR